MGIGASIGYNQIYAQTTAGVLGPDQRATLNVGSLSVSAMNADTIDAVGVSAGVSTGESGEVAGAFTLGINVISSSGKTAGVDPSIFAATPGIVAIVDNATVIASGAVSLTAEDDSVIQSIAGAVGVGAEASGFGIGLSWNEMVLNVEATVDVATISASSFSMLSESTQDAGLVGDKIATLAVGAAVSGNASAVGASVSVNGIQNSITATLTGGSSVTTTTGDVTIDAEDNATIAVLVGGAGIAPGGNGVGVGVGGNYIANTVDAEISAAASATAPVNAATSKTGNVTITATEAATIQSLVIGLGGGESVGVAASVSVGVITNTILAQ